MKLTEAHDALSAIARKLDRLNSAETGMGLPPIEDAPWEWERRVQELHRRVQSLVHRVEDDRRPDEEMLTSVGAHVLAFLVALHRAEMADPTSGNFVCIVCRDDSPGVDRYGDVCAVCERNIAGWGCEHDVYVEHDGRLICTRCGMQEDA
jgi:hypothetical protein